MFWGAYTPPTQTFLTLRHIISWETSFFQLLTLGVASLKHWKYFVSSCFLYIFIFLSSLMGLQVWSSLQVQRCNPDYLHWSSFQQSSTGFLCHCMEDYRGLSGCSCHGWGQYFDSYVENHDIVSATDVRIWGEQIKYEFQKLSVRNCFTEACEMFRFAICRWKTLYMYINNFSFFWPF